MVIIVPALVLAFSPILYTMARYRYGVVNALLRLVYSENGTVWAAGFSEAKYSSIRPGMAKEDVLGILGEPVKKWNRDHADSSWSYTWQREGDDNFDRRTITFSQDGRVTALYREFYLD